MSRLWPSLADREDSGTYWPPPLEVYCPECRRMVEARHYGGGSKLIPVRHYRVDLGGNRDHVACYGTYDPSDGRIRPGQEDPVAAFYLTTKERDRGRFGKRPKGWTW